MNAACIDLNGVDGLVIENLTFENCWLSAVRAVKSRRVTLRDLLIKGGSFGLAVSGDPFASADHITVEDVTWVQDATRICGDQQGRSPAMHRSEINRARMCRRNVAAHSLGVEPPRHL